MNNNRRSFLNPIFLAIYPILFLYTENLGSTSFLLALWPILISLAVTITLLWIINRFFIKDSIKSSLIISLLLILFFSYGHLHSVLNKNLMVAGMDTGPFTGVLSLSLILHVVIYFFCIVIAIFGYKRIVKAKQENLKNFSTILNIITVILISLPVITIISHSVTSSKTTYIEKSNEPGLNPTSKVIKKLGYKPDIYYIILDGYARQDILKQYYNFDNDDFIDFLKNKGFYVAPNSRSNFFWTILSLSSSLNMEYVTHFEENPGKKSKDKSRAYAMLRNNRVYRLLKNIGYKYVHFKSTFSATRDNPFADMSVSGNRGIFQTEFYRVLFNSTALRSLAPFVGDDLANYHLSWLKKLENISSVEGPKFVFAHFLPPHHPYLFDRDGNILRHARVENQFQWQKKLWAEKEKYIDQMIFLNQKIKVVIEGIQAKSANPPIIIIQSDHGPQLLDQQKKPHKDYDNARSGILFAVLHPLMDENLFPDDITPVNLFSTIFNHYFEVNFDIIENKYYSSSFSLPYLFEECRF